MSQEKYQNDFGQTQHFKMSRTYYVNGEPQRKMKVWSPLLKIIKNLKMVTVEH